MGPLIKLLRALIARVKHKHEYKFYMNLYGDQINVFNGRSLWRCECGKAKVRDSLHDTWS